MAHWTTWKVSTQRVARGTHSRMASSTQRAPSALTSSIEALPSSPIPSRKASKTLLPQPSWHQTTAPVSWFTTTVMYLRPFL